MNTPYVTGCMISLVAAVIASVTDLRQFRIPNQITLSLLISGLLFQTIAGGTTGLIASGAAALIGFAILLPLYVVGGMGAGDLKLVAGIGAWVGPVATLETLSAACLLTSIWSVALLIRRRTKREKSVGIRTRVEGVVAGPERRSRLIPFGVSLTAGLLVPLIRHWPY